MPADKDQFTYPDGASPSPAQFQKAIQGLRSAVENRDRIIQQYKDHLSETTLQNEQLDAELQEARLKADHLLEHLQRREQVAAARLQAVMQAVEAAQTMARQSAELAARVQQGQAHAPAPDDRRAGRRQRAQERFLKDELFNLSREIEADENRLERLLEEDAWAAWLLWGSRQYRARLQELESLIRSADAFEDRNALEDLRRRASALGAALQEHLRERGQTPEQIQGGVDDLFDTVRAESERRCALAELSDQVAALVAEVCTVLGRPDADLDALAATLDRHRQAHQAYTSEVIDESRTRTRRLGELVSAHPAVLDVYEQRIARRFDVPVEGPPGTALELIDRDGDVRLVCIGARGRAMVRGLERGRRYELRYAQTGMVEQSRVVESPAREGDRWVHDAWLITLAGDDDVAGIVATVGDDLALAESLLSTCGPLAQEIGHRQALNELAGKVAGLGPALRRAAPEQVDVISSARTDLLGRVRSQVEAYQSADDRESRIAAFLEQYPELRCGALTRSVVAHLRQWPGADVRAQGDRLLAQLEELDQEIAVNRHVAATEQVQRQMSALAEEMSALLADAGRIRTLTRKDLESDRCPHCGAAGSRSGSLGDSSKCLRCSGVSVLLAGVAGVRAQADRLCARQRQAVARVKDARQWAAQIGNAEAYERFFETHPDYRSRICGDPDARSGAAAPTPGRRLDDIARGVQALGGWLDTGRRVLEFLEKLSQTGSKPLDALGKAQEVMDQARGVPLVEFDLAFLTIHGKRYGPLLQDKIYGLAGRKLGVRIDEQRGEGVVVDEMGAIVLDPVELGTDVPVKAFGSYLETRLQIEGTANSRGFRKRLGHASTGLERAMTRLAEARGLPPINAALLVEPHWGPDNPLFAEPLDGMLRDVGRSGPVRAVQQQFTGPLQAMRDRVEALLHELELASWFRRMQNLRYRCDQVSGCLKDLSRELGGVVGELRPVWSKIDELLKGRQPDAERIDLPPKQFAEYEDLERQATRLVKRWKTAESRSILLIDEADSHVEAMRKQADRQHYEQVRVWLEGHPDILAEMVPDRKSRKTRLGYVTRMNPKVLSTTLEERLNDFEEAVEHVQQGIANQHITSAVAAAVAELANRARSSKGSGEGDNEGD